MRHVDWFRVVMLVWLVVTLGCMFTGLSFDAERERVSASERLSRETHDRIESYMRGRFSGVDRCVAGFGLRFVRTPNGYAFVDRGAR